MVENFKANAENGWRRPFYESPLEWWKQGYRGTEWQPNPVFVERFHHGPHTYRSRTHETGVEARLIIKPCARNRATSASRIGLNLAFWFTSRNSVPAVELRISEITAVFKISIESFYQNFLFKRIHPPIRMPRKLRSSSSDRRYFKGWVLFACIECTMRTLLNLRFIPSVDTFPQTVSTAIRSRPRAKLLDLRPSSVE